MLGSTGFYCPHADNFINQKQIERWNYHYAVLSTASAHSNNLTHSCTLLLTRCALFQEVHFVWNWRFPLPNLSCAVIYLNVSWMSDGQLLQMDVRWTPDRHPPKISREFWQAIPCINTAGSKHVGLRRPRVLGSSPYTLNKSWHTPWFHNYFVIMNTNWCPYLLHACQWLDSSSSYDEFMSCSINYFRWSD